MNTIGEQREVHIDGQPWQAIRYQDEKFRLFQSDWGPDSPTSLPAEKGLCSYCLDGDTYLTESKATVVCESCGKRETIVCASAETVREVKVISTCN